MFDGLLSGRAIRPSTTLGRHRPPDGDVVSAAGVPAVRRHPPQPADRMRQVWARQENALALPG
jgi:hypothetical protein